MLGDFQPDFQALFFSWGLAHFLDDVCRKQAGIIIPPNVMRELTGEAWITWRRENYDALKRRLESLWGNDAGNNTRRKSGN